MLLEIKYIIEIKYLVKGVGEKVEYALKKNKIRMKGERGRNFPGGAVVRNPPANAGDTGSSPGLGRSHMPWSN